MEPYLQEKFAKEVEHYQNSDFLKAATAAFVLTAHADRSLAPVERCRIDQTLNIEPCLRDFDFQKASEILDSYSKALKDEGESAKKELYDKVRRMTRNRKQARTIMRVCYFVLQADGKIGEGEIQEFRHLCSLRHLEPAEVWRQSGN